MSKPNTSRPVVARLPRSSRGHVHEVAPPRAVRVDALELEGRLLLAAVTVPINPSLGFVGTPTPGTSQVTQVVSQQDGAATVTVSESGYVAMQEIGRASCRERV